MEPGDDQITVVHCKDGFESIMEITQSEHTRELNMKPWIGHNWGTLDLHPELLRKIGDHLKNKNIVAASDGLVWQGRSAHAFCLATKDDHEILVKAAAPVDYLQVNPSSYRAESFGALAVLTLLNHIGDKLKIQNKTIKIYIDNSETVQTINKRV